MDPVEPILGPFLYPDTPQKGDQFQARVWHLCTPNKVIADSGRSWIIISVIFKPGVYCWTNKTDFCVIAVSHFQTCRTKLLFMLNDCPADVPDAFRSNSGLKSGWRDAQ